MATVTFKRGDTNTMGNTPITDGMLFFNEESYKIYMDNGTERLQYGGDTDLIVDPSTASATNAFSSTGALNIFLQKTTVVNSKASALAVTQNNIPLGCLAFKEMLGTNNYSSVGDGTVSGGLVSLRGETLQTTLAATTTTVVLTSTILTSNSYIDIYTNKYDVSPKTVTVNDITKQITLTFDAQDSATIVRVIIRNM